jgi:hypothetical protein
LFTQALMVTSAWLVAALATAPAPIATATTPTTAAVARTMRFRII